jgi:3-oxoacyl-[acyl-carrier protein] reductase
MDLRLEGKHALVVGASQGLGLGCARALLAEGANVTLAARSAERLHGARSTLPADQQIRCSVAVADLGDEDAPRRLIDAALAVSPQVDILINNTGGPASGPPSAVSIDEMRSQYSKMVHPVLALTVELVAAMRVRKWGRIITIASSGIVQPIPHLAVSNALRSSLAAFMKTLAGEVAADEVTVNMLAPGRIATARTQSLDSAQAARASKSIDQIAKESASAIPVGRYGTVEEFGAVAAFLAGESASYVTGSIVRVDGGMIRSL